MLRLEIVIMSCLPLRPVDLPDSFYANQSLEEVLWTWVDFTRPAVVFSGFALLKALALYNSRLTDDLSCPLLEGVTIDRCDDLVVANIAGPSLRLKHLTFRYNLVLLMYHGDLGRDRI